MYAVNSKYDEIIYSGDAKHTLNISFLPNADTYCEKLTIKPRIIPNGNKNFGLDSFVSKEAELVLRNLPSLSVIQDQFTMSITTSDRQETFSQNVPLGVFNISDKPTTDKDKTTIKLYDNAIKFDFNYDGRQYELTSDTTYQAGKTYYSLNNDIYTELVVGTDYTIGATISTNVYQLKNSWTKKEVFLDILSKAGVNTKVTSFLGENDTLQIWDSTVTARVYISYIAEQAGAIATIDRDGDLIFVYLKDLETARIPLWVVEKYELGKPYEIGRVVYEDGIRTFAYPQNEVEDKDILFINASNPYIYSQEQITSIYGLVNGFKIDSFKTGKILGNPAIDPYDFIEIYNSYSQNQEIIAKTLATYTMVYNGVIISTYETQIGEEKRTENVSLKDSVGISKRYAKSEIDPVEARITLLAGEVHGEDGTGGLNGRTNQLEIDMYGTSGQVGLKDEVQELSNDFRITAEGFEMALKKSGNNILMGTELYDLSQWGKRETYFVTSNTPPDTSQLEQGQVIYWYCSQDNEQYENGVIYEGNYQGVWTRTNLLRKDLEQTMQNAKIIENEWTKNNFVSQRVLRLGRTSTKNYLIDTTKGELTFSCKIQNNVENGKINILLSEYSGDYNDFSNNAINTIAYTKIIHNGEYNDLSEVSFTLPIITDKSKVTGYFGTTEPQNTEYWLDSYYMQLKHKESDGSWKSIGNKVFYDSINDIYYIPQYGDEYGTGNYFYTQTSARNFETNFINAEFIVQLDSGETSQVGDFYIGDIKLEYGDTATIWTNNRNEVYGKNYKMDDKGFHINKGDYELYLDEDELTGYYKNSVLFQLNEYRSYSKIGVFEETDQNGLITKKISNDKYVRYIK